MKDNNIVFVELEKDIYCKLPCLVTTKEGKLSRIWWCYEATLDADGTPCIESDDSLVGVLDNKDLGTEDTLEIFKTLENPILELGFKWFRLTYSKEKIYV